MAMPPLPNFHKKKEADFGLAFRKWIEARRPFSSACELKQTATDSLPFNALADNQVNWLMSLSSDKGALVRVTGMSGEPDYIWCRNMPCHVFIKYPRGFVGITIGNFVQEKNTSSRKSLTWERAKELASFVK
jgi:hypothetical protein